MIDLAFDAESYVYARRSAEEIVLIAVNRAAAPRQVSARAAALDLANGAQLLQLLVAKERAEVKEGTITLNLPARMAVAYKVSRPQRP